MKQLKTNNFLVDDLEIEARHIKCDQAIKRVLATMSILARTVKGTVTEVKNMSIAEIESAIDHESIEISSVRINPGATAFTVTCFLATSCASALVAAIIPPLAAE